MPTRRLPIDQYISGVLSGDRAVLARAITLIESDLPADADRAAQLLDAVLPHTGKSRRVGVTGVPGVGKSTFLDTLGLHILRDRGEKLAVLTIDPSSPVTGGSILGDKTRMERLSSEPGAFIRPSPSRGYLGGVARRTRETMLLCEAAGFHNVFIETVGVGQSEITVRSMTDFLLLLLLPGAGDELQGVKRGILELVDALAINKADGPNLERAQLAQADYRSALHLFSPSLGGWAPPVLLCSARTAAGIPELWDTVLKHQEFLRQQSLFDDLRREQALHAMQQILSAELDAAFRRDPRVSARLPEIESLVRDGRMTPFAAARALLDLHRS